MNDGSRLGRLQEPIRYIKKDATQNMRISQYSSTNITNTPHRKTIVLPHLPQMPQQPPPPLNPTSRQ